MVGTIEWLDIDDLVWDYSFARPDPAYMASRGVKAVSRYISVPNSFTRGKIVTLDEIKRLADVGIRMIINLETNPGDPLQGAPRGTTDGQLIERYRSEGIVGLTPALQFPLDLPVIASLDVGVSTAQINGPCTDYWYAINDSYAGQIGDYHGVPLHRRLLSLGLSGLHWTAGAAKSWSYPHQPDDEPTHMLQLGGETGVDYNQCLRRIPVWNIYGEVDPKPPVVNRLESGGDMAGHVCFAQRVDGTYVEIVTRMSDGMHRWRRVGSIPGGNGTFYAVHPNGSGVNPIGDNECNIMTEYNALDDVANLATMLRQSGGTGGSTGAAPTHFTGTIDIKAASS